MKADLEFHRVIGRKIQPEPWTRPADWLPLPEVAEGEQKFVGLYAVFEGLPTLTSFLQCFGNYTIDWGDGIVEDYSSGAVCSHTYDYNALPAGSYCSRGYKQVVIIVTAQDGSQLTKLAFSTIADSKKFLQIVVAGQYINTIEGITQNFLLEYFEFIGENVITSFSSFLSYCYSLSVLKQLYTGSGITFYSMLNNCSSLTSIPNFDTSNGGSFYRMLYGCSSLTSIPVFDFSNATSLNEAFRGCTALIEIHAMTVPTGATLSGLLTSVRTLCKSDLIVAESISYSDCSLSKSALVNIFNRLAIVSGKTITITGNVGISGLTPEDRAIATDKGWTITG